MNMSLSLSLLCTVRIALVLWLIVEPRVGGSEEHFGDFLLVSEASLSFELTTQSPLKGLASSVSDISIVRTVTHQAQSDPCRLVVGHSS